jgi:hypothetical protein
MFSYHDDIYASELRPGAAPRMGPRDSPAARESAESWCRARDPHPECPWESCLSDPTRDRDVRGAVRRPGGRPVGARPGRWGVGRVDAGRGGGARAAGHNAPEQANTYST